MSGISVTTLKEVHDPDVLKRLSDKSKGPDSAPSSRYTAVEQVAAYLDYVTEEGTKWGKRQIDSGLMNADGSINKPQSAQEVYISQQRTIKIVEGSISIIKSVKDFLSTSNNESAAHVKAFTKLVEDAKANLERAAIFASTHQGLVGQLLTKDGEGNYKIGAFVLTSSSIDGVLRTGSSGDTQISNGEGEFTSYILTCMNSPAKLSLDIRV